MSEIPSDILQSAEAAYLSSLHDSMAGKPDYLKHIALAILAERDGWQPVKGDEPVNEMLLLCDVNWWPSMQRQEKPPIKVGYKDASMLTWKIFGASWVPTHFMPLPKPPATKEPAS